LNWQRPKPQKPFKSTPWISMVEKKTFKSILSLLGKARYYDQRFIPL
jgi:hypothetical protein